MQGVPSRAIIQATVGGKATLIPWHAVLSMTQNGAAVDIVVIGGTTITLAATTLAVVIPYQASVM